MPERYFTTYTDVLTISNEVNTANDLISGTKSLNELPETDATKDAPAN